MEKLEELVSGMVNKEFVSASISGKRNKSSEKDKIKLRHIIIKETDYIQASEYIDTKVMHRNMNFEEAVSYIIKAMENDFRQCLVKTQDMEYIILTGKKGKVTINSKKTGKALKSEALSHDKPKNYLIKEGYPVDFLIALGVMNKEGYVIKPKYDKFRQINRFLQFIDDIAPKLPSKREIKIIDFGCGKSYLTFAVYYFLKELKGLDVNITGLDLKEDVINNCNTLARKLNYDKLEFLNGDIADYTGTDSVDMVITLHACDTATDYAIAKAVEWNARVIMSVPCCQHELNKQIENELLSPILKYGILKERISALITDGIRAELLRENGYSTQIIEFIDMEHTPKNLMIRAVRNNLSLPQRHGTSEVSAQNLSNLIKELNAAPTLKKLLDK